MNFLKYQSLGNDFIFFDWFKKPEIYVQSSLKNPDAWSKFVASICHRNYGVGADGVIILKSNAVARLTEMLIFNSDGSPAEMCLNGLRCAAHRLFTQYKFANNFKIACGGKIVECLVESASNSKSILISTKVDFAQYATPKTIELDNKQFSGHVVSVGNPHFVIFKKCEESWLVENGKALANHKDFANQTNVEFVWPSDNCINLQIKQYRMLTYERGCGTTLACSSGACAVTAAICRLEEVKNGQAIDICMDGGTVNIVIENNDAIFLKACANIVFDGEVLGFEI
jgi:diaminopimelate epimerase